MIITTRIKISRIIKGTWKNLVFIIIGCYLSYLFEDRILQYYFDFPAIFPTILGTALAFFIGFNNNQAYDRWWEARKIWGELVNSSRNWTRQLIYYTSAENDNDNAELAQIRKMAIYRHIGFLYALKAYLRGETGKTYRKYLSKEEIEAVEKESNIHNAILSFQSKDLEYLNKKQWIDGFRFIEMNKSIINFCNDVGKSERIKNTVFPPTYNYYTRVFIWILIISTTFELTPLIGLYSIIFGVLIGYVFLTTHTIGQVLLNPFEPLPSGVPLDQITRTIEINLLEALKESEIPKPVESINDEYIM